MLVDAAKEMSHPQIFAEKDPENFAIITIYSDLSLVEFVILFTKLCSLG